MNKKHSFQNENLSRRWPLIKLFANFKSHHWNQYNLVALRKFVMSQQVANRLYFVAGDLFIRKNAVPKLMQINQRTLEMEPVPEFSEINEGDDFSFVLFWHVTCIYFNPSFVQEHLSLYKSLISKNFTLCRNCWKRHVLSKSPLFPLCEWHFGNNSWVFYTLTVKLDWKLACEMKPIQLWSLEMYKIPAHFSELITFFATSFYNLFLVCCRLSNSSCNCSPTK